MASGDRTILWPTVLALVLAGVPACAPRPETAVVHLADPPPRPVASGDPEPELEPAPAPPRSSSERASAPEPEEGPDPYDAARARARELFQQGAEAYAQGDYPKARQAFQAAYDLVPERALLFNIASCDLRLRDLVSACAHFRKYVADGDPSDPRIQQVQSQVTTRCGSIP